MLEFAGRFWTKLLIFSIEMSLKGIFYILICWTFKRIPPWIQISLNFHILLNFEILYFLDKFNMSSLKCTKYLLDFICWTLFLVVFGFIFLEINNDEDQSRCHHFHPFSQDHQCGEIVWMNPSVVQQGNDVFYSSCTMENVVDSCWKPGIHSCQCFIDFLHILLGNLKNWSW